MNRQDSIQRIIKRAKLISAKGYATYAEMQELSVPKGSIYNDSRYKYGTPLVTSESPICGSIRLVEWIGGIEEDHLDYSGQVIKESRYWVAYLVEIRVQGNVEYSIPFPALGVVGDSHDREMWKFSQERLEKCNDIQLGLIGAALNA